MAQNSRAKKIGIRAGRKDRITPYDHLAYLLFEFEQTLERGGIDWTACRLERMRARVEDIVERLARASDTDDGA